MKSIFYVLLIGVVGCSKPVLVNNNDLDKKNLKGNVKSIYTVEQLVKKKNGKFVFQGEVENKYISCFNQYGLITYSLISSNGSKSESRYEYIIDDSNRIKKIIEFESPLGKVEYDFYYKKNIVSVLMNIEAKSNLNLVRKSIKLYANNKLVRENHFLVDKKSKKYKLKNFVTYYYNKNNQDSITNYYSHSKKRNFYIIYFQDKYFYDQKNKNLIKQEIYDLWYHHNDPANVEEEHRSKTIFKDYHYKFDKHGNWIEEIVNENGVLKGYKRKIIYYD